MMTFSVNIYDHLALPSVVRVEVTENETGSGLHMDMEKDGDKSYGHVVGFLIDGVIVGMED